MGMLDEPGLQRLVDEGCKTCGSHRLEFFTYVDGIVPIMGGEPVGKVTWVYDGEKFVDGVFEVRCTGCNAQAFVADACPRCHAAGALRRALETPNQWPVPSACPECDGEELRYFAFMPARVIYEGTRAEKARTFVELYDDGFHGYRAQCKDCGPIANRKECPLCDAAAPLRKRPG